MLNQKYCEMTWNDKGATCVTDIPGMKCPRCHVDLEPNQIHQCGDFAKPESKPKKAKAVGK